jgi:hypothetical protein
LVGLGAEEKEREREIEATKKKHVLCVPTQIAESRKYRVCENFDVVTSRAHIYCGFTSAFDF